MRVLGAFIGALSASFPLTMLAACGDGSVRSASHHAAGSNIGR